MPIIQQITNVEKTPKTTKLFVDFFQKQRIRLKQIKNWAIIA